MNKIKTSLIMSFFTTLMGFGQTKYTNEKPTAFAETIATKNMQIVDARTAEEYAEGHLKGALLIDYFSTGFKEKALESLHKEHPVAIYCRSGRRSAQAATLLNKLGFQVINLDGGIIAWEQQKLPIIKGKR